MILTIATVPKMIYPMILEQDNESPSLGEGGKGRAKNTVHTN